MALSSFNVQPKRTQTPPFSSFFRLEPALPLRTRACTLLDPGGLVAHGFQLFEQETTHPIDSRYVCPYPVSTLNLNGPKLYLFVVFRYESALPHTHAHVTFRTLEVWVLTGFNFLNRRPHTQSIAGNHARLNFQC